MTKRKNSVPTLPQLRKIAGPNVVVWDDVDCGCYRATANDGHAFDDGTLHELVAPYDVFGLSHGNNRREARADLGQRLEFYRKENDRRGIVGAAEPCTDADCEWCHSEFEMGDGPPAVTR